MVDVAGRNVCGVTHSAWAVATGEFGCVTQQLSVLNLPTERQGSVASLLAVMKSTVAWAADNTPRDKVPDRLEEDVRLQDAVQTPCAVVPESRAQRSPNMIVYNVTYETD